MPVVAVPPPDTRPRVLVAICHNLANVERKAAQSLIEIGWGNRLQVAKDALGIAAIDLAWFTQGPRVDLLRNVALAQALRDGFTHVVFLDADMIFPTDVLHRLLRHVTREAVISGFYTQRHYPYAPVALRNGTPHASGRYTVYETDGAYDEVDADGLRAEEVVGMGCALIPLSLVRAIGARPWFHYKDDVDDWPMISEDVPFCERVRAAGFGIFLDPSIQCGHLFTDVATERHWQRYTETAARTQAQLQGAVTARIAEAVEAAVVE